MAGFFKDFIYLFLERGEGREREKHQCVVASPVPPTGDLACNPGMCPDWESNGEPLVLRLVPNPLSQTSQDQVFFFFLRFYLSSFLEIRKGKEKERKTSMCGCFWRAPHQGPGPNPRHVP